jgi:hypothetical protein
MIDNILSFRINENFAVYNFSSRSLEKHSNEYWAKKVKDDYPNHFKHIHRRLAMPSDSERALNMEEEVKKQLKAD